MSGNTPTYAIDITTLDKTRAGLQSAQRTVGAALAQIKGEADKLDKQSKGQSSFFEQAGKRVATAWHTLGAGKVSDEVGRVATQAKSLGGHLKAAAEHVGDIITPLNTLIAAGGLAGLGVAIERAARNGAELMRTSQTLGMSTQSLQGWRGAAELSGLSADAATSSFRNLNKTMYEARAGMNPLAVVAAHQFGLNLAAAPQEFAKSLADVMKGLKPQEQQRLADIFGVQVELFRSGSAELSRLNDEALRHTRLSTEQTTQLDLLDKSFIGLSQSISGALMTSIAALEPILKPAMDDLSALLDAKKASIAGEIAKGVDYIVKAAEGADWNAIGKGFESVGTALKEIVGSLEWMDAHREIVATVFGAAVGLRVGGVTGMVAGAVGGAYVGARSSNADRQAPQGEATIQPAAPGYTPPHATADAPVQNAPVAGAPAAPIPGASAPIQNAPPGATAAGALAASAFTGWTPGVYANAPIETQQEISHPERNNPGNLRASTTALNATGRITEAGQAFESFDSPEHGIQARARTYASYLGRGINTAAQIAARSGPAGDGNDIPSQVAAYRRALGGRYEGPGGENLPIDLTGENLRRLTAGGLSIEAGLGGKGLPKGYGVPAIDTALGNLGAANANAAPGPASANVPPGEKNDLAGRMAGLVTGKEFHAACAMMVNTALKAGGEAALASNIATQNIGSPGYSPVSALAGMRNDIAIAMNSHAKGELGGHEMVITGPAQMRDGVMQYPTIGTNTMVDGKLTSIGGTRWRTAAELSIQRRDAVQQATAPVGPAAGKQSQLDTDDVAGGMIRRAQALQQQQADATAQGDGSGDTSHHVQLDIHNAPPGSRVRVSGDGGPADIGVRVHHAMDAVA